MNRFNILIRIVFAIILGLSLTSGLYALTATEIIKKSDQLIRGDSQVAIIAITVRTRRWTRTMKLKSYQITSTRQSFTKIYEPKKDAGNRFLLIKKSMWHYVPKLQQTVKISPSMMLQSWMGSDFSNDDIVKESSLIKDYIHTLTGEKTVDGHLCYQITLNPKPDSPVVWGSIVYYARKSDYLPVRQEFYNEHKVLKKVMTLSDFKKMGGRVIPTRYKMQTIKKKSRYTLMVLEKVKFNVKIPKKIFSLQNLKRR